MSNKYTELRCEIKTCRGFLVEARNLDETSDVEIQCSKCRNISYPLRDTIEKRIKMPKGIDFMADCLSNRCWNCHKLLFKSRGEKGQYKIKCYTCKRFTKYDIALMREGKMKYPKSAESTKNRKSLAL